MLLIEGVLDTYYLPRMVNALATAAQLDAAPPLVDASLAERLRAVGGDERAAPFSANRTGFDGAPVTLGVVQHAAEADRDGHFVVFDQADAKFQYACFLRSAANGAATVAAPKADPLASCP